MKMNKQVAPLLVVLALIVMIVASTANAQMGAGPCQDRQAPPMAGPMHMHGPGMGGPGMGKWWKNSALVQKLGISDAQVQQIEKIFQDHRMQLIDQRASLEKEEARLEPLIEADRPDEGQVTAQIEKVAQARANLEKSNALMLLAVRQVLTVEQWKQLQSQQSAGMKGGPRGPEPAKPPAK